MFLGKYSRIFDAVLMMMMMMVVGRAMTEMICSIGTECPLLSNMYTAVRIPTYAMLYTVLGHSDQTPKPIMQS